MPLAGSGLVAHAAPMSRFRPVFVAWILLASCKPSVVPQPHASTPSPPPSSLATLQKAAEESALDAFQKDRRDIGWPRDVAAASSADYIALLRKKGYLSIDSGPVHVANVGERDPLNTALARTDLPGGRTAVIRKDGTSKEFATPDAAREFAPSPPADPPWLP